MGNLNRFRIGASAILVLILAQSYYVPATTSRIAASKATATRSSPTLAPKQTDRWFELLKSTPYAHTTPLPPPSRTGVDGTFARLDPSYPQWWRCLRCADYRPAGGIWKLHFDKGVMRIYYDVTGWRSIASFSVSGDRIYIFNDSYCPQDVGEYTWSLVDGDLQLDVIDDPCSIRLRGRNLSKQLWRTCLPPNAMAAVSGYWRKPPGCEQNPALLSNAASTNLPVAIAAHEGDSRKFVKPPEVYAYANSSAGALQEGIRVTHSDESIPYGLNRVLWGEGDWIQASTNLPFAAIGVQFLGDSPIGWARVLFDGVEVWRGDTSAIWSHLGRHGGYIEISGFDQGMHTIRAESLGLDYHPVTVAFFGFNHEGGIETEAP